MSQKHLTLEVLYYARRFWESVFLGDFLRLFEIFGKNKFNVPTYDFSALRVRRTETRLTVYWASQYQNHSKPSSKRPATFDKKHHFKVKIFQNECTRWPYVIEKSLGCQSYVHKEYRWWKKTRLWRCSITCAVFGKVPFRVILGDFWIFLKKRKFMSALMTFLL